MTEGQKTQPLIWWTAAFGAHSGQAIVTARVIKLLKAEGGSGVAYPVGRWWSPILWPFCVLQLWIMAVMSRPRALYIVCSRSNIGFLRDIPAYLLTFLGLTIVAHSHGSDISELLRRPIIGRVAKFLLTRGRLIVPSKHLIPMLRNLGMSRVFCCENFYSNSTGIKTSPGNDLLDYKNERVVLWNSNILSSKGFFVLADALGLLVEKGWRVRFLVLGDCLGDRDMSRAECKKRLQKLTDLAWVTYRGKVSPEESMMFLSHASLVCLPSTYSSECQPLAIIEAMCRALPIVIADTEPLRATVETYPCIRVPLPIAAENLALAIMESLASTEGARLTDHSVLASKRFSSSRFDSEILDLVFARHSVFNH